MTNLDTNGIQTHKYHPISTCLSKYHTVTSLTKSLFNQFAKLTQFHVYQNHKPRRELLMHMLQFSYIHKSYETHSGSGGK